MVNVTAAVVKPNIILLLQKGTILGITKDMELFRFRGVAGLPDNLNKNFNKKIGCFGKQTF